MTTATAALVAMNVDEKNGEVKKEEGEEEECSVCLNAIEIDDSDNPVGPPLVCGHRYHAFCLHFWVERCTMNCIEPTCPYCRLPLQEMGSARENGISNEKTVGDYLLIYSATILPTRGRLMQCSSRARVDVRAGKRSSMLHVWLGSWGVRTFGGWWEAERTWAWLQAGVGLCVCGAWWVGTGCVRGQTGSAATRKSACVCVVVVFFWGCETASKLKATNTRGNGRPSFFF